MIPSYKNCIITFLKYSHLSYTSHFKVWTSSLYLKETLAMQAMKITVCFFQISHFAPDIFIKVLKYAKWWCHKITKFGSNMMKKDISANLHQKSLTLCSEILVTVLRKMSFVTMATHGFQTSLILKAFEAIFFGIPFWYLQVVPHLYDQPSI